MHRTAAISGSRVVYSAAEYEGLDAPRPKMGMLDERAESTLCGVAGFYIADFGGGEQQRAAARCWLRTLRGTAVLPGLRAADGQGELTWRDQTCPARASRLP